jgi:SCY1-like protein 1
VCLLTKFAQVGLAFVNDAAASTHGNVCVHSIFISPSGEWKLGGFELLSSPKDEGAVLYVRRLRKLFVWRSHISFHRLWVASCLTPPHMLHQKLENPAGPFSRSAYLDFFILHVLIMYSIRHHPAVADAYALALLLHTTFNPSAPLPSTTAPPTLASRGTIPTAVFAAYKRMLNPNPKARLSPQAFLELGTATTGDGGFFANNPLVKICAGLDNFALSSEVEKAALLR